MGGRGSAVNTTITTSKGLSGAAFGVGSFATGKEFEITTMTTTFIEQDSNDSEDMIEEESTHQRDNQKSDDKLSDFGEKIGGARKDLWKERGMISADVDVLTAIEAEKYVKRDVIWKLNHEQLLADGYTPGQIYALEQIRKSIPNKPSYGYKPTQETVIENQKLYIDTINQIKDAVLEVDNPSDYKKVVDKLFIDTGLVETSSYGFKTTEKFWKNPALDSALFNNMNRLSKVTSDRMEFLAKEQQIGVPKEAKVPNGYKVLQSHDKMYSGHDPEKPWIVAKSGYVMRGMRFKTQEEAISFTQEASKSTRAKAKQKFVPKQLESIKRTGEDYRSGNDIKGDHYLKEFKFRAGEFGNWMTENDRRESMNMGYDALKDLSKIIETKPEHVSLNGKLAIAFGARGKAGAAAHYEPGRKVINLTKINGAGSLAHEWFHAVDNIVGESVGLPPGQMMTENVSYGEDAKKIKEQVPSIERLVKVMKYNEDNSKTEYYSNSIKMDKFTAKSDGRYWQSNAEMAARAFACYVTDKNKNRSDYLSGHSESAIGIDLDQGDLFPVIPQGKERDKINQVFDQLFDELKKKDLL